MRTHCDIEHSIRTLLTALHENARNLQTDQNDAIGLGRRGASLRQLQEVAERGSRAVQAVLRASGVDRLSALDSAKRSFGGGTQGTGL
jgi:hypothetical protein